MKQEQISLTKQIENFNNGLYNNKDIRTQIEAGWYDWFCKNSSLPNKTQLLYKKVKQILSSNKFDNDKVYVFFKNNCPMDGSLYDDFRICDLETGDVIFTVTPKSGHKVMNGKGEIWGCENSFHKPLFEGTWEEIKQYFLKDCVMYNFEKLQNLHHSELQDLSIEATKAYNSEKPYNFKKSKFLTELITIASGIHYMDKFSEVINDIRAEVIRRFNNREF